MRSKHFLSLCLVGGFTAAALTTTGCSDDSTTGTTGSGGSGGGGSTTTTATTTTTSATTSTSTTTSSSSSGTGGGTSNHDFDTAIEFDVNAGKNTLGTLVDTDTTDFYKFTGKKGQRITAVIVAQSLEVGTPQGDDDTIIDPVVTIYDSSKTQLAQNDDAWPRTGRDSQAFTVLPADGDYYLTVNDCNAAFPGGGCAPTADITILNYEFFVADVTKVTVPNFNEGVEPNDDSTKAVKVEYKVPMGNGAGDYGFHTLDGSFQTATDIDVYALTFPADTAVSPNQRAHAEFWVQPISSNNGTGATTNGKFWLVDELDPTKHLAEVDQINYSDGDNPTNQPIELSVPVTLSTAAVPHTYYLFVQHGIEAPKPDSDFYFIKHAVGTYYIWSVEKLPDVNDTALTAEAVPLLPNVDAGHYYLEGDLSTPLDVDYFVVDVATGATDATLSCNAQRVGSGLRDAKFSLLKTDGSPLGAANSSTEVANKDSVGVKVALPANTTKVVVKVEAGSQDANVSGAYYRCGIGVAAP